MGDNMLSSGDASRNVSQRGVKCFSLIELLVVIAIIAILAGMLLPALNTVRAKASQISCISNMKQVFQAQNEYMDSYNDWLPAGSIRVDGYIFSDKTVSDIIPGTSFLLYTGFIKSPMAAICPETIKAAGSGRIKKWCSDQAWSAVGNYMYAPVIYQYGNDHTGKSFTSAGYTRTAKFTQTVVLPYPRRYPQPSSYLQNIDATNKYCASGSTVSMFQANSNMSGSLSNPNWSGYSVTNEVTVMPAAVHRNMISAGSADGSVQSLTPRALKDFRLFFYRDSNNINHKL